VRRDRFAREVKRQQNPQRVTALVQAIITRFGGVDRLATAWKDQFDAAMAAQPGGRQANDLLLGFVHLWTAIDRAH
jgi:hypothetical protein